MPKNDSQTAQDGVSRVQPTPKAVTVEGTLDAIYDSLGYYQTPWLTPEGMRATIRAHLEALVQAVTEAARRDYLELQAVADHNIALERAENARLRPALRGCLAASTERERAKANYGAMLALSPATEKKEADNGG